MRRRKRRRTEGSLAAAVSSSSSSHQRQMLAERGKLHTGCAIKSLEVLAMAVTESKVYLLHTLCSP